MLNENQIFKRMQKAYIEYYGDSAEDEWYGSDDSKEWEFHRPSTDIHVKMVMDEAAKRIDIYEGKTRNDYKRVGNYSW